MLTVTPVSPVIVMSPAPIDLATKYSPTLKTLVGIVIVTSPTAFALSSNPLSELSKVVLDVISLLAITLEIL